MCARALLQVASLPSAGLRLCPPSAHPHTQKPQTQGPERRLPLYSQVAQYRPSDLLVRCRHLRHGCELQRNAILQGTPYVSDASTRPAAGIAPQVTKHET